MSTQTGAAATWPPAGRRVGAQMGIGAGPRGGAAAAGALEAGAGRLGRLGGAAAGWTARGVGAGAGVVGSRMFSREEGIEELCVDRLVLSRCAVTCRTLFGVPRTQRPCMVSELRHPVRIAELRKRCSLAWAALAACCVTRVESFVYGWVESVEQPSTCSFFWVQGWPNNQHTDVISGRHLVAS